MESEVETIRAWFAYIADARRGYLETLSKLPPEELARDRGASFPTLLDIFAHSQGALYVWMKSCATFPFPPQSEDSGGPPTIDTLRKDETYVQTQIQRVMAELTDAGLARTFLRERGKGPSRDPQPIPVRDALWHLVEEELQHRGEINALLWQIDVDPPIANWIRWARAAGRIRDTPA